MSGDDAASEAVLQARAAREKGELWRARDLLAEHVEQHSEPAALLELGAVLHDMGDLPRAGAIWFAAGAKGPEVDAAVAAWREQANDDFGVMWRSLPASVRAEPRPRRIEALRARAVESGGEGGERGEVSESPDAGAEPAASTAPPAGAPVSEPDEDAGGIDANWVVAWVLAAAFVVFAVIGFVTALGWIVPG